jgi:hypothetical protein
MAGDETDHTTVHLGDECRGVTGFPDRRESPRHGIRRGRVPKLPDENAQCGRIIRRGGAYQQGRRWRERSMK